MDKRTLLFLVFLLAVFFFVQNLFHDKKTTPPPQVQVTEKTEISLLTAPPSEEKFYVLENEFIQLVFSNQGGSLSELNLPFANATHPNSPILPIEFDQRLKKDYSLNATFPLFPAFRPNDEKASPGVLGNYYPLLRRSLVDQQGKILYHIPIQFYACHLTNGDPEVDSLTYEVTKFQKDLIEFTATQSQRKITKTFSLSQDPKAPYCFDLTVKIEGDNKNFWIDSGIPEVELTSGSFTPILKYFISHGEKSSIEKLDLPKTETTLLSLSPEWICNSNGFLGTILDPVDRHAQGMKAQYIVGTKAPTRLSLIDSEYQLFPAKNYPGYQFSLRLNHSENHFRIFSGPFQNKILKAVDAAYNDPIQGKNPHYIEAQSFQGWFSFISEPFAKFLLILMEFFHWMTSSWGISIILLTIALRIMLYPLNSWSIKSMSRMQEIAPQVKIIQNKHKKDPKKAQIEIMQLYRSKGVNPFTGCLPILIQMPFLIGMFDLLKSTFALRGVPFIPGWITNLTAPDTIFTWNYPLFFIGTQLHLLPLILGGVMYIQQKISTPLPKDKKDWTDQQKQQQIMGLLMPGLFTVLFYHVPSGLNIYWLSSMLLGIAQQWWTLKLLKKKTLKKT